MSGKQKRGEDISEQNITELKKIGEERREEKRSEEEKRIEKGRKVNKNKDCVETRRDDEEYHSRSHKKSILIIL